MYYSVQKIHPLRKISNVSVFSTRVNIQQYSQYQGKDIQREWNSIKNKKLSRNCKFWQTLFQDSIIVKGKPAFKWDPYKL